MVARAIKDLEGTKSAEREEVDETSERDDAELAIEIPDEELMDDSNEVLIEENGGDASKSKLSTMNAQLRSKAVSPVSIRNYYQEIDSFPLVLSQSSQHDKKHQARNILLKFGLRRSLKRQADEREEENKVEDKKKGLCFLPFPLSGR